MSNGTLTSALLIGGLATGGYLLYRSARSGAQQEDVWGLMQEALNGLLDSQEGSTTVPKSNTPGPSQTSGATTVNSVGDPIGTTYQVGDPHPTDQAFNQAGGRVVYVDPTGTSPIFSSLPQDVINTFLAQFKK